MAIKIRKDGVVQDLVINANEVRVLDKDGNFRSKNLETVLKELNMNGGSGGGTGTGGSGYPKDAEYVYVKDSEPDMDGVWFDESDVSSQPIVGDNSVVKAIREYIDTDVKTIVDKNDKIVSDIKTKVGDKLDVVSQLSNENLLANGDFQIWSLGTSFGTGLSQTFSADKWNIARNEQTTSKTDKGVKVVVENASSEGGGIIQTLKLDNKYIGQPITLSASIKNTNTMVFGVRSKDYTKNFAFKILEPSNDFRIVSVSGTLNNFVEDVINIELSNETNQNNTFEIEWVKLEFGEVKTPFVPKTYSEELLACNDRVIGSNPNLLINGDFRNPINQRGQTSYNHGYTIDRWTLWNTNTNLTINNGYCTLSGDYDIIAQHLENPPQYSNQTVTLSARIRSNGGSSRIVLYGDESGGIINQIVEDTNGKFVTVSFTGKIPNLNTQARLTVSIEGAGGSSIDIEWAKLELGSVATPFIPRHYAEELALCQRYYQIVKNGTAHPLAFYYDNNGLRFMDFFIPLATAMRITPTFGLKSGSKTGIKDFDTNSSVIGFNYVGVVGSKIDYATCLNIRFNKQNGTLKNGAFYVTGGDGYLDAEIYP